MTRTNRCRGRFSIGTHALSAVLVECRRVDGKPRQRFIAQLGTIEVWDYDGRGDIAIGTGGRASWPCVVAFWRRVSQKLDTLRVPCDRLVPAVDTLSTVPMPQAG